MSAAAGTARKERTEAELQALPEDGFIHEVVNGELVMSPEKHLQGPDGSLPRLLVAISQFVTGHKLGAVLDSATGFWMFNRNCRAPDVSFVSKSRLTTLGFKANEKRFFPGAPTSRSKCFPENNTRAEIDERFRDFFGKRHAHRLDQ